MERIKFKIHPSFILFSVILIYFGQGFLFLNYLIVLFLHEFSHAFVARKLGYKINSIGIIPFGVSLNINSCSLNFKDEIKISLAGPLCNLFLCLVCFSLWWIFPATYNFTFLFCFANFVTFIFNMMPCFPLDGGRIFRAFLKNASGDKLASKICKIVNIIVSVLLLILFVYSIKTKINFTYLFVIFCILSSFFENKGEYSFYTIRAKKIKKNVAKIKTLYVKEDEKLYKIIKYIDSFSYLNLQIYDQNEELVSILSEREFLSLLENNPPISTFKEAKFLNKEGF